MKKIVLLGLLSISLVGCLASQNMISPKTSLVILFPHYYDGENYPIVKLTPELQRHCGIKNQKYISWGNYDCNFGSNPPNQINLMVALIPYYQIPQNNNINYINAQVNVLPPSAWRTHTIYPKQLLEQGTSMPIWDTRYNKVADDQKAKSRVTVTLYIDGSGNISQDIKRTLVLSDSVW